MTEAGQLWVTVVDASDPTSSPYRVDRADPTVRVTGELLDSIANGDGWPWTTLDQEYEVVTIRAINRTVVYRLDGDSFDPETRTWTMRWPD